jgi:hypothetical protein
MQTKQQVSKKPSHPIMGNIKQILAMAPRLNLDIETAQDCAQLPQLLGQAYPLSAVKKASVEELRAMILTSDQLARITTQQTMIDQILKLIASINENAVLAKLNVEPLIIPELGQRLQELDGIVTQADYANIKLGRGAVIAKAKEAELIREEEIAKAEAMHQAIAGNKGTDRANEIMKNRKVA